jgi:hypothetical protein
MSAHRNGFSDGSVLIRPLDEEQERLVEILRAANGRPVTFEQFRSRGIENPATLAYELEIAGIPIAHVQQPRVGGSPMDVGIRLEPSWLDEHDAAGRRRGGGTSAHLAWVALAGERTREQLHSAGAASLSATRQLGARLGVRARAGHAFSAGGAALAHGREALAERRPAISTPKGAPVWRWVAAGALAVVAAAALAIGLAGGDSGSPTKHVAQSAGSAAPLASEVAKHQTGTVSRAARRSAAHRAASRRRATVAPVPAPTAAQLQAEGHRLLEEGSYAAAVSTLRGAVNASGVSPEQCAQPTSQACRTYAFALYDLGRALRLDNDRAAAVAVLRERLLIDDQRSAVEHELALSRPRKPAPSGSAPADRPGKPTHPATPHHVSPTHKVAPPSKSPPPWEPNTGGAAAPASTSQTVPQRAAG